jgi:hypothetical protein
MESEVVISIDVEWAHPVVLADVVQLLDERGLRATFFCTHQGIELTGHERALHPNYRRSHNSLVSEEISSVMLAADSSFYRFVVSATRAFCPEAVGVRAHSLFFDSDLLSIYREAGLEYDSTYMLPLAPGLAPVWKGAGILELPIYYMDYWDLREQATGFDLSGLRLELPGLKVVDFHPNLIYLNAATAQDYLESKSAYQDPDWLRARRNPGRGIRTLFVELLNWLAAREASLVMAEVNARWRAARVSTRD